VSRSLEALDEGLRRLRLLRRRGLALHATAGGRALEALTITSTECANRSDVTEKSTK
jgi:hypothetical protein